MTIAISLKINDGLVLAADSASTVTQVLPGQGQAIVLNVYNSANKIFNLRKGFPLGAITWGGGSIGNASIERIVKDHRARFSGKVQSHKDWEIKESYSVEEIAKRFRSFVFEELYASAPKQQQQGEIGFIVAGYSSNSDLAEEFTIVIKPDGTCDEPRPLRGIDEVGATWAGQPEALNRLMMGFSPGLQGVLEKNLGVPSSQIPAVIAVLQQSLQAPMIVPPMPLQDAIDLAAFMVETTIQFTRFMPGPSTVGGPVEIAAISKHEGFRWVRRKHYYNRELNPQLEGEHKCLQQALPQSQP